MLTAVYMSERYPDHLDISRMPAQVVSGIGFLGAGTILREGFSVKGLTTAASLWAVSCVGLAVGSGFFVGALVATFVIYLTLNSLKKVVARGHAGKALYIEVKDLADEVPQLSKIIRRSGAVIHSMEILYDSDSKLRKKKNTSTIKALIFPKSDESLNMIISTIRADENVVDIYVD
jgi:putative Mg2+ transporter-C (MgtC) family protein